MKYRRQVGILLLGCVVLAASGSRAPEKDQRSRASQLSLTELRSVTFGAPILSMDAALVEPLVAVGLSTGKVVLWRSDTGEVISEIVLDARGSEAQVEAGFVEPIRVRFSPKDPLLAASYRSRIYLYQLPTLSEIMRFGVEGEETYRRPTPMKKLEWPKGLKFPLSEEQEEEWARLFAESQEEKRRYYAGGDGITRVTDFEFTRDGKFLLVSYCRGTTHIALPLDTALFTFPSGNDPVRLWNVATGEIVWEQTYDPEWVIQRVIPSPDGRQFAAITNMSAARRNLYIHDLSTGERKLHVGSYYDPDARQNAAFSSDGLRLVAVLADPSTRRNRTFEHLAIYDVQTGKKISELRSRRGAAMPVLSPNGRLLVTTNWRPVGFQVWDLELGRPVARSYPQNRRYRKAAITEKVWGQGGTLLIIGTDIQGIITIYRLDLEE